MCYYKAWSTTGRSLGLFFFLTFKSMEEGHNCVLFNDADVRRGDSRPWTPSAGLFVYCGSFSASVPVMKPQKVAEMDFSQRYAAQHTPSCQRPLGPVCVGAAKIMKELRRNSPRCGRRLQTAPLQASSVTFDFFFPLIGRLTAASAIPGFGFWFLLLHMWSLTPIHPGPLCTSTQRQTTKHRWSYRNSGQRPGWFVMGWECHN